MSSAREDEYFFSSLEDGWFSNCFEDLGRFPFIGAREALLELQKRKGVWRQIVEAFGKHAKISSVLSVISQHLVGFSIPNGGHPNKIADAIFKALDEADAKRTVQQFLTDTQKRCRKLGRYFDTVSRFPGAGRTTLWNADQKSLEGEIIVVSGQLVHKNAIGQYNDLMAQKVANLPGDWLISDFPPHGMVSENERFKGHAVAVTMEDAYAQLFSAYLPYRSDFGWYPYVRVTGFFREPGYSHSLPSLELIMTEFRRPKSFEDVGPAFFAFLKDELRRRIRLESRSDLLLASYVLPLLTSFAQAFRPSAEQAEILEAYLSATGSDLPIGLKGWYADVLARKPSS